MRASSNLRVECLRTIVGALLIMAGSISLPAAAARPPPDRPNILFFVLDDVGIDQMKIFGYGGATAPRTPNIDAIANAGVGFRNFWTMPECSPSRALMFEGRYPLRTHVYDAILSVDLANSQVSPYETTTPKVLRRRGYESGLFGKFHLTGSDQNEANNPLGYTAVHQLGWNYFAGWQDGAPHPIDTTAGGMAPANVSYQCGFIPNAKEDPVNGADTGACYFVDKTCVQIAASAQVPTPGRTCMEGGGIFAPKTSCGTTVPAGANFTLQNGYYAGQLVINRPDGSYSVMAPQDPSGAGRGYRSIIESDRAIDWINMRPRRTPWMATVSYSSAHTPFQQPPTALLPAASVPAGGFACASSEPDQRVLSNQMIEAMDAEIGRVLVETGIATRGNGGKLHFDPERSDTMIVIMGDNGTYAPVVKAPFNPLRAKATAYQTGVWTPLIVAGPLVNGPGRQVSAMVNIADVFQLFAEIAGINVDRVVPDSRPLDSVSMLPYLENRHQRSLRKTNFTQTQPNIKAAGYVVPPCVIAGANTCVQLFPQQQLCATEGGIWWGAPDTTLNPPAPIGAGAPQPDCCSVNKYALAQSPPLPTYAPLPNFQMAIRDDDYKLLRQSITNYDTTTATCVTTVSTEFYRIDDNVPPKLDNAESNLLAPPHTLDRGERRAFTSLTRALADLLDSNVPCTGDGNLDGVVDQEDIDQFNYWANVTASNSSWYDLNLDGLTNQTDVPYITQGKFPRKCPTMNTP
jgi:Sulfatase